MLHTFFQQRQNPHFPRFLYDLTRDMFSIVQFWEAPPVNGPQRGRLFEQILYRYCEHRNIALTERSGSRTIRGEYAASGFMHESDAVIAIPELTVHLELKYLSSELGKNDLLIFNQKGIDFLMTESESFRSKPLYRVVLSGSLLSPAARRFAVHWGILTVEPDRLPFLLLHELSNYLIEGLRQIDRKIEEDIWKVVPHLVVPLQTRINQIADSLNGKKTLIGRHQIDRAINVLQREYGDEYWLALDEIITPNWLESYYEKLNRDLWLDELKWN